MLRTLLPLPYETSQPLAGLLHDLLLLHHLLLLLLPDRLLHDNLLPPPSL